ncbi:twin-arginine translocase TatA/TatE family subunit [Hymenobacter sp. BT683]|uniref:Sec-independent protein translocase protein TatA n=1 Tax=Hymenobacter jeongseonensis TaxID=2791027 RepID=A0ABS0IJN1_9BACT|nr:twin-arginine translocase TatA/TatE family subunit [Hymenobacter jeongseonensis]MBF9238584.1 twin-arginine translocase TatA/TatE family subunit [Hymenobacter jeongseonensis]
MQTPFILFLGDIGGSELMLIMVVILIFFGANKIPELARGLGKGIREFKDASTEIRREFEQAGQPAPTNYAQQQQPVYDAHNQPASSLPSAPVAEAGSGFDPWAAPATASVLPTADADYAAVPNNQEPAPPVAPTLPPNLAPEGTQPRQPYIPAAPSPNV